MKHKRSQEWGKLVGLIVHFVFFKASFWSPRQTKTFLVIKILNRGGKGKLLPNFRTSEKIDDFGYELFEMSEKNLEGTKAVNCRTPNIWRQNLELIVLF